MKSGVDDGDKVEGTPSELFEDDSQGNPVHRLAAEFFRDD